MSSTGGDKFLTCWHCGITFPEGCVHHCGTAVRFPAPIIAPNTDTANIVWRVIDDRLFQVLPGSPPL